ncbi:MAG: Rdx family protein [Gemmatimonadaceae bacterium]|nr:Rdx family protein [Gemmatimonadaceae bacterium]
MAASIRERYPGAEVTLDESGGGRFEVVADGRPVFEKSKLGRHAMPGEVMADLKKLYPVP